MKFIDLFAGLGGFNQALSSLGHECVFASELDPDLQTTYKLNFGIEPAGDIRQVALSSIPQHDILCAGFPCQSFSKAGEQRGFRDSRFGDLFDYVLQTLDFRTPQFFLLENVPNLSRHARGETWAFMENALRRHGYDVKAKILSPHQFGIPQIRERLFIVGKRGEDSLAPFQWPSAAEDALPPSLSTVLEAAPEGAKPITPQIQECLEVWQEFLERLPSNEKLPSFPIWSMEFGATYPYEAQTPYSMLVRDLRTYRGSHGSALVGRTRQELLDSLPSYAATYEDQFPGWKKTFIRQNRELYKQHKQWLDAWKEKLLKFPPSLQKFEWNCQGEERDIWKYVIQIRASGVRVKRPTTAPSLIAMTSTQVPIVAWEKRYMTVRECARLQSMDSLGHLPSASTRAYAALGNAVNVNLVRWVAAKLFESQDSSLAHVQAELAALTA